MLAKISASLDEVADDKAALSQQQREQMEAQIMADALMIERAECSLVWHAEAQHETIDFRSDTTPMALLGVQLVNQPRANGSGTSAAHAFGTSSSRGADDEIVQPEAAACFLPGMREARGRFDAANGPAQHRRGSSPVPLKGTGYLGKFQ